MMYAWHDLAPLHCHERSARSVVGSTSSLVLSRQGERQTVLNLVVLGLWVVTVLVALLIH
jgi:hypothetical protein